MKYLFFCLINITILVDVAAQGFAVVELFTSQGCSSCPAADKNLSEILLQAETGGQAIYCLSFHVDYWNYLGWKDPYSSKEFTGRQRKYGEALNQSSVYTPQMIVNGTDAFVGSDKNQAMKEVEAALALEPIYKIAISRLVVTGKVVSIHYTMNKNLSTAHVNAAVVERNLENFVPNGENKGQKLSHDNVVLSFMSAPLKQEGDIQLNLSNITTRNATLILYVQDERMRIVSAAARHL